MNRSSIRTFYNTHTKLVQILFLTLASLGLVILYATLCFNRNIWTDEAFTIDLLNNYKTFGAIADYTATDVHPPLYYFILKIVTDLFGIKWPLIKLMSVVPVALTLGIGITYVRKRFGFKTALIFILLTGAIPCTMEYAVQMRMYAWCMLFVTGCGFAAWDVYETGRIRSYLALLICGVGAAYSHYFAFTGILWIHGILFIALLINLIRQRKPSKAIDPTNQADQADVQIQSDSKKDGLSINTEKANTCSHAQEAACITATPARKLIYWVITAVLSVLIYLPWLSRLLGQISGVTNSYWIQDITWDVFLDYFRWIFASDYPLLIPICQLLFGGCILWLIISTISRIVKKRRSKEALPGSSNAPALWALAIPILVIATGIALSKLIRPIFIIRYIMPCIPLLCFSAACVLSRIRKEVFAVLVVFLIGMTSLDYCTNHRTEYEATRTDATCEFIAEHLGENDAIVYNYRIYDFIYWCYWPQDKMIYIEDFDYGAPYDHVWFLQTVYNPNFNNELLAENGWNMLYMGDYGIEQNDFWIWELYR